MNSPQDSEVKTKVSQQIELTESSDSNDFNLQKSLSHLRRLLPAQGPIQDFVHHNTLHAFQHLPFDEALIQASQLFGSNVYLPLEEYHLRAKNGEIHDEKLFEQIHELLPKSTIFEPFFNATITGETFFHFALWNYREYLDSGFAKLLLRQESLSIEEFEVLKSHLAPLILKQNHQLQYPRTRKIRESGVDIDSMINPILIRLISSYLDQGISQWPFPGRNRTFFEAVCNLVNNSILPIAPFFWRSKVQHYFKQDSLKAANEVLGTLCRDPDEREAYLRESLFSLPGWAGMVSYLEDNPSQLTEERQISLLDFLAIKLLLEHEALRAKSYVKKVTVKFNPINTIDQQNHRRIVAISILLLKLGIRGEQLSSLNNLEKETFRVLLKYLTKDSLAGVWNRAMESSLYSSLISAIETNAHRNFIETQSLNTCKITAIFCIDDRATSVREYLEQENSQIATESTAGFFGIDFLFQSSTSPKPIKLCPVPVQPKHLVREKTKPAKSLTLYYRVKLTVLTLFRELSASMIFGWAVLILSGPWILFKLLIRTYRPSLISPLFRTFPIQPKSELEFIRKESESREGNHLLGYSYSEMAERIANQLLSTGLSQRLTPLVIIFGHGSSSVNNPYYAAYDCGACSGRPGAANARAFASMANLPQVRKLLQQKNINIPEGTYFLSGYHDTCKDECTVFDEDKMPENRKSLLKEFKLSLDKALKRNSKERVRRFNTVPLSIPIETALQEVRFRSHALFEPRPELNHATNAFCIVGRRYLTHRLFLDRRAFLQSYNPELDPNGELLSSILSAVVPVCGGINLEYFFSRVDNEVYGSGTKLPHNVASLLGVTNGVDDDLRTGLPKQMIEAHDPIRCLFIIEKNPEELLKILKSNSAVSEWFDNRWVTLVAFDPKKLVFYNYSPFKTFELVSSGQVPVSIIYNLTEYVSQHRENLNFSLIAPTVIHTKHKEQL
ncbi:MAG: DUF2309 domain-containing protein [Bdellovibrionia bacterium]